MNIDKAYSKFKITARFLNLQAADEVRVVANSAAKMFRIYFWLGFPITLFLGIVTLPLFGFGLIFLVMAALIWFIIGKKPRVYKAVAERYITEMGLE